MPKTNPTPLSATEKPNFFVRTFSKWMMKQLHHHRHHLSDFATICDEIHTCDVLLIEGHSRASRIIKEVTQSAWSHAALYVGEFQHIRSWIPDKQLNKYQYLSDRTQCLIESEVGYGTIISPISKYEQAHIRLARPRGLKNHDKEKVVRYTLDRLGTHYSVRHILDLARFLFPWTLFPRRWRSSLFEHNAQQPTHDICSSLIAKAFQDVEYPLLPKVQKTDKQTFKFIRRNPKLITPSDFDYSPYFDIIKYPLVPSKQYKNMDWDRENMSND